MLPTLNRQKEQQRIQVWEKLQHEPNDLKALINVNKVIKSKRDINSDWNAQKILDERRRYLSWNSKRK